MAAVLAIPSAAAAPPADPPPVAWLSVRTNAPGPASSRIRSLADQGYRLVPVPVGVDSAAFAATLSRAPGVVTVESDVMVYAADTAPSDPLYADYQSKYLRPIGAERAWDLATGSASVIVAIVDSGADLSHPEFAGRLWENPGEVPDNGVDDDGNGCIDDLHGCRFVNLTQERATACGYTASVPTGDVRDDHGQSGSLQHSHGTIVSGVIGARGNNAQGVTGIAWDVRMMVVKVLDCGVPSRGGQAAGDLSNVAQGIDYARRMGARVINVSLSTRGDSAGLSMLREAVAAAQGEGVIVVAAAGNHAPGDSEVRPGFPAAYGEEPGFPALVVVGAADNRNGNTWATYSNYGPAIDLAAPGNDIASTTRRDLAPSTGYGLSSQGTSLAAPIVSGMFALMMARNPALTAAEYVAAAKAAATPPAPAPHGENWAGAGVVDLGRAVARVPMTVSGVALHDWKDVPAGSQVRALVGSTICGETTTSPGPVATFVVKVRSAAETTACGVPGQKVTFQVNGLNTTVSVTWGGKNASLAVGAIELTSVTPDPGPIVVQSLRSGWNNIGNLGTTGSPEGVLSYLPANWTEVRVWDPSQQGFAGPGRFLRFSKVLPAWANDLASVQAFGAAWVFLSTGANVATANPGPVPGRAIALQPGWNNFVYTGSTRQVEDALGDITGSYTAVARFDNATGRWGMYWPGTPRYVNDFGALMYLGVYWVYATEAATLVMR